MRFRERSIPKKWILDATGSYEIIESYPDDKYLPSYLVWAENANTIFHILFAVDMEGNNVRVVTVYKPDPNSWVDSMKLRRMV